MAKPGEKIGQKYVDSGVWDDIPVTFNRWVSIHRVWDVRCEMCEVWGVTCACFMVCGGLLPSWSWDLPHACSKLHIKYRGLEIFNPPPKLSKSGRNFLLLVPFEGVWRQWGSLSLEKLVDNLYFFFFFPGRNWREKESIEKCYAARSGQKTKIYQTVLFRELKKTTSTNWGLRIFVVHILSNFQWSFNSQKLIDNRGRNVLDPSWWAQLFNMNSSKEHPTLHDEHVGILNLSYLQQPVND